MTQPPNSMKRLVLGDVAKLLRPIPDFPKEGILFWDIQPLLRDPVAVQLCVEEIAEYWADVVEYDVVAGFDARGFLFGQALALHVGKPFEQIRKKGKLPGKVTSQSYGLEYGEDVIEMIDDGFITGKRVLLVDDVLATGGTALAGAELIEKLGGTVVGFSFVTEIPILGGRGKLGKYPIDSLISIIDDKPVVDVEYCVDALGYDPAQPNNVVLIQRLNDPLGIALPGGHFNSHESALDAVIRECSEETGYEVLALQFQETLASLERDPRGTKVSLLYRVRFSGPPHAGERAKTKLLSMEPGEIAEVSEKAFICDVYDVLSRYVLEAQNAA